MMKVHIIFFLFFGINIVASISENCINNLCCEKKSDNDLTITKDTQIAANEETKNISENNNLNTNVQCYNNLVIQDTPLIYENVQPDNKNNDQICDEKQKHIDEIDNELALIKKSISDISAHLAVIFSSYLRDTLKDTTNKDKK